MKASCGGHADAAALEQNKLDGIIGRAVNVQLALEMIANIFSEEGVDSDEESSGRNESMDIDGHDKSEEDSDSGMDQGDDVEKTDDKEEDEEGEGLEGEGKGDEDDEFDADDMDNILAEEGTASRATTTLMSGGGSIISYFVDNIVPSLFNLMQPTHVSFANTEALNPVSNPLSVVSETFSALHQRAFGCFNNFLLIVEEVQKTWFKVNLQATVDWWSNLARLVEQISQSRSVNIDANASAKESQQQQQQQQHEEVLEGAIGCLWACARGLKAAGYMASAPAPSALVEGLVGICQTSRSPSLHVKCIGALGLLACREPGFVEDNRKIGTFLIQGIQATLASADGARISHEHLEPVIEALDSIYDIYSDKAFDYDQPVFVRGEFLKALKQALPEYRKVVRVSIDRRKHRELRERADLALANLRAFVDFKAQEAS
ncbi:hypothetical protein EV182_004923 [Spiromyces aspiralis]|uniref:Uncharacterized protein n=1 Tax=Spiromyces aspiralis TaxID=68401 RepID=A0ACC1HAY9_9FUNG|nr:hypothetical protein EV182_004923 [Spiromyces aspiralis]